LIEILDVYVLHKFLDLRQRVAMEEFPIKKNG
jgi:hypothetical protein